MTKSSPKEKHQRNHQEQQENNIEVVQSKSSINNNHKETVSQQVNKNTATDTIQGDLHLVSDKPEDKPEVEPIQSTKSIGRPKTKDVTSKKVGNRNAVGRPKGDAAIINEYKARMLNSPKSRKVLETILNAALDDDHKGQQAAWKLVIDRILPVSTFDKAVTGNGRAAVNITISGLKDAVVSTEDPLDADYEEIND